MQQDIANNIYISLGGERFKTMTGAKDFMAIEFGLQFDLPRRFAKNGITKVRIVLDANDTYTVTGLKWVQSRLECEIVSSFDMVYSENLREVFTTMTGLDTTL